MAASPSVTVWSSSLAVGATLVTVTVVVAEIVLCTPSDTRTRTVCVAGPSRGRARRACGVSVGWRGVIEVTVAVEVPREGQRGALGVAAAAARG